MDNGLCGLSYTSVLSHPGQKFIHSFLYHTSLLRGKEGSYDTTIIRRYLRIFVKPILIQPNHERHCLLQVEHVPHPPYAAVSCFIYYQRESRSLEGGTDSRHAQEFTLKTPLCAGEEYSVIFC